MTLQRSQVDSKRSLDAKGYTDTGKQRNDVVRDFLKSDKTFLIFTDTPELNKKVK